MRPRRSSLSNNAGDRRPQPRGRALDGSASGDLTAAIIAIQSAIRTVNEAAGLDPLRPQEVSRALKLNKNLTWKCARVLLAEDALDAIPMLPGPEGIEIYLRGFSAVGVDKALLDTAREAYFRFDAAAVLHFGSRPELDSVLDSLRRDANLEQSRRAAFRANSAIFGVQAAARVTMHIVEPPVLATAGARQGQPVSSITMVVGLAGIRRLRPMPALPIFRTTVAQAGSVLPLRPPSEVAGERAGDVAGDDGFLLREFSSFPEASVRSTRKDGRLQIELLDGPIGRLGESSMYFGSVLDRAFFVHRSEGDTAAEFVSSVSIPAERFLNEVYIHKAVPIAGGVEASWHATLAGPLPQDETQREHTRLPIDPGLVALDGALAPANPDIANYDALRDDAFAARGLRREDFRLFRIAIDHPAAPSALLVRWELPPEA